MSHWVQSGSHQKWTEYLYDLAVERDAEVPEAVPSHVRKCVSWRERIVRLKEAVLGTPGQADKRGSPGNRDVIDMLDSHLRYLNQRVTCRCVLPFFPDLLDGSIRLRVPTPITVHLDHCPQCAEDLRLLRELNLGVEQLQRLRWLYGQKPAAGFFLCRRARSRIAAFVRGAWKGIDNEILRHLSTCPRCRADVYACRQSLLDAWTERSNDCCGSVPATALFDCVVPRGEMAGGVEFSGMPHGGTSRRGLEMMQAIHRTVYGVVERAESGVATVYRTAQDDPRGVARSNDPYAEYPITVEVCHCGARPASSCGGAAPKAAAVNPRRRRMLKTAVAAAAIIPLAVLFHYTPGASGTTLGKVVHSFRQAKNVRVVSLDPYTGQIIYELWVARELNFHGMMTARGCFVYDLTRREKEDVVSGVVLPIGDLELANVREMGDHCLGFTLAGLPSDATCDRMDIDGNREIYELAWMRPTYAGRDIPVRYEIVVDKATRLPASLRLFRIELPEIGWKCKSLIVFQYLTGAQMKSVMAGESLAEGNRRL